MGIRWPLSDDLNLMREIREALEAGRFSEFRQRFRSQRARGV